MLNEGGEDSIMSTPNMSFDSPIVVTKSSFGSAEKKDTTVVETSVSQKTDDKESKPEEDKRAKKKDMFAPEADMFAEEYSVSNFSLSLF